MPLLSFTHSSFFFPTLSSFKSTVSFIQIIKLDTDLTLTLNIELDTDLYDMLNQIINFIYISIICLQFSSFHLPFIISTDTHETCLCYLQVFSQGRNLR